MKMKLTYKKETKNTFVYEGDSFVPQLYIQKSGMPGDAPDEITLTLGFDKVEVETDTLDQAIEL